MMADPRLSARQIREVNMALRHIGRAMSALSRANLPGPVTGQRWLFSLHAGERRLGQASDELIDGLEALPDQEKGSE